MIWSLNNSYLNDDLIKKNYTDVISVCNELTQHNKQYNGFKESRPPLFAL